jgi:hypothetical protein
VGEPVLGLGKGLIDTVVEVLVVGEDNVATDIVELEGSRQCWDCRQAEGAGRRSTHEAFGGDICRGQATGSLVGIDDQPRWVVL